MLELIMIAAGIVIGLLTAFAINKLKSINVTLSPTIETYTDENGDVKVKELVIEATNEWKFCDYTFYSSKSTVTHNNFESEQINKV